VSAFSTFVMGHLFRWFPHRAPTGLVAVGSPGADSPVLVSCNYTLSVARLLGALRGLDAWVLVAQSSGINVWCAACGGEFTEHQVISAVKTSMLASRVAHRTIVLPALSAPGMDVGRIESETGFRARFGPVRAGDLPAYLRAGMRKTGRMKRYGFGLADRMDKLVSMNFVYWLPAAIVAAVFWPEHLVHLSALFWGVALATYALLPWIPGRSGWAKALVAIVFIESGYVMAGYLGGGRVLVFWPWMIGIASNVPSEAEALMHRLGARSMGSLMKPRTIGRVALDTARCTGCLTCEELCPIGVFERGEGKKTRVARGADCFSCGACVKQCPEDALSLAEP
jgi:NAD-dependent dihydropyrimidine dehydrogenase PreA subunit